ncbi:UNVERIFIED_CONTAM: hypothetical protein HDU68_009110 [Siphonaria sp. JEL0065]|nr:hypothetical protein HDU68_009110 [Siphonaria sp. JEL0065]
MTLMRNIALRQVEDAEIRVILKGLDFNAKTAAEEKFATEALARKITQQEMENLEENEALVNEHLAQEESIAQDLQQKYEEEQESVRIKIRALESSQLECAANQAASNLTIRQRRESEFQKLKEARDAKIREKEFWKREEGELKAHLERLGIFGVGDEYLAIRAVLLRRLPKDLNEHVPQLEEVNWSEEDISGNGDDLVALESAKAREKAFLETLQKTHNQVVRKLQLQHKKIREQRLLEQQRALASISADAEINKLEQQYAVELEVFDSTARKTKGDNDEALESQLVRLPLLVSEKIKTGSTFDHTTFSDLAFLQVHIVDFESTMLEAVDGEFRFVAGLQNQGVKNTRENVEDVIQLSQQLIQLFRDLDLSGQVVKKVEPRFGIHIGAAVGGVIISKIPQFSVLGDTVDITDRIEKTSRGNEIHISGPVHELVKDAFECEVSESVEVLKGTAKSKIRAFWVSEPKNKSKSKREHDFAVQ